MRYCFSFTLALAVLTTFGFDTIHATTDLQIEPTVHHLSEREGVNITCKSERKLTACVFRVFIAKKGSTDGSKPIDFSKGNLSDPHTERTKDGGLYLLYNASYHGSGLDNGECGISIGQINSLVPHFIGCRVRAENHTEWEYKYMTVYVSSSLTNQETKTNNEPMQTVMPDTDVHLNYSFGGNITSCRLDNQNADIQFGKNSTSLQNDVLPNGYCHITIKSISENVSGLLWPSATKSGPNHSTTTSRMNPTIIVVGRPPNSTELAVTYPSVLEKGRTSLTAKCAVKNGRPVANITWFLGDEIIRCDAVDDEPNDEWMWPWDVQSITQTVTRNITSVDNGKELRCRVQHMAMKDYVSRSIIIDTTSLSPSGKPTKPHPQCGCENRTKEGPSQPNNQKVTNNKKQKENQNKRDVWCPIIFGVTAGIIILVIIMFLLYAKIKKRWIFSCAEPQKHRLTLMQVNDVYGCNTQQAEQQRQNEGTENTSPDVCRQLDGTVDDNTARVSIYTESPYAEISMDLWPQGPISEQPQP